MQQQLQYEVVVECDHANRLPFHAHPGDAGWDLKACLDDPLILKPGEIKMVDTGLKFSIPRNMEVQVRSRSGLASKGVVVANAPGTIDSNYTGPVKVILANIGDADYTIMDLDRIAQAVPQFVPPTKFVRGFVENNQERGSNGFGSTGVTNHRQLEMFDDV